MLGWETWSCLRNGQGKHRGQLVGSQTASRRLKRSFLTGKCLGVDSTSVLGYEVRSRLPAWVLRCRVGHPKTMKDREGTGLTILSLRQAVRKAVGITWGQNRA